MPSQARANGTPTGSLTAKIVAFRPREMGTAGESPEKRGTLKGSHQIRGTFPETHARGSQGSVSPESPPDTQLTRWLRALGISSSCSTAVSARLRMIATADLSDAQLQPLLDRVTLDAMKEVPRAGR